MKNRSGRNQYLAALKLEQEGGSSEKVVICLDAAAKKGFAEAQYALGTLFLHGKYVEKDLTRAFTLLRSAADQMHAGALFDIGNAIEIGDIPDVDASEAFRNYVLSMLAGDNDATYEVARCFYYGIGVREDRDLFELFSVGHESIKKERAKRD